MPNCCVPNCKGNYPSGPKVSVFSFPREEEGERRRAWLRAICREGYTITKSSRVCERHFPSEMIETTTRMYHPETGELLITSLAYPRLKPDAVPSILPGCPSYLSKNTSGGRESPAARMTRLENAALEEALKNSVNMKVEYEKRMGISSFEELQTKLCEVNLGREWLVQRSDNMLNLLLVPGLQDPKILCYININRDLQLRVLQSGVEQREVCGVSLPLFVKSVNTLDDMLSKSYKQFGENPASNDEENIKLVLGILDTLCSAHPEKECVLLFLKEQFSLIGGKKHSHCYSWETVLFASLFHSISPHAYRFVRNSEHLILPHPSTLKRVTSALPADPVMEQNSNFLAYIRCKFNLLRKEDRLVSLMMDGIHITPRTDYKGGNIVGFATGSTDCASSAHVFMIQSLLSKFKDVVHVLPAKDLKADELYQFTKRIIIGLEDIGFEVLCLVCDNHPVNRKAVALFSNPPELLSVYPHPIDTKRPLFWLSDPVHNLKNCRNNWYNQKPIKEMFFPDFVDTAVKHRVASWQTLIDIHSSEKDSLVKFGYGLTLRALHPTFIERQNVKLALQIFNHTTVAAVRALGPRRNFQSWEDTASFLEIICRWWDIVNVKSPWKGKRLSNPFQEPITKQSLHIFEFLEKFLLWLDRWKNLETHQKLTRETHLAMHITTKALMEMAKYCLNEKNFSYFLCGKIQTDQLEARFGKYRRESGCVYHISIRQLFESERILRMQSTVPLVLHSQTLGSVPVFAKNSDQAIHGDDSLSVESVPFELRNCAVDECDVSSISDDTWPLLVYVAGYCAYAAKKHFACNYCSEFLTAQCSPFSSFIDAQNRGGLCYPNEDVLTVTTYCFITIEKLIKGDYEPCFLRQSNQREIVMALSLRELSCNELFEGHNCSIPAHSTCKIIQLLLKSATNTFLNNYAKKCNDIAKSKKSVQDYKRRKV